MPMELSAYFGPVLSRIHSNFIEIRKAVHGEGPNCLRLLLIASLASIRTRTALPLLVMLRSFRLPPYLPQILESLARCIGCKGEGSTAILRRAAQHTSTTSEGPKVPWCARCSGGGCSGSNVASWGDVGFKYMQVYG
eukprot:s6502_g4.t1